jgi:predicted ester cyclase
MSHEAVLHQLRQQVDQTEYDLIRYEWKTHSIAEDKRDLPGLMSTLTDDCVYTLINDGTTWHGKEGATRFYTELLTAFPDIKFHLQNIVIGPQGVFEEAHVTGTFKHDWLHFKATGEHVEFNVAILFPWDPAKKKFRGERVLTDASLNLIKA